MRHLLQHRDLSNRTSNQPSAATQAGFSTPSFPSLLLHNTAYTHANCSCNLKDETLHQSSLWSFRHFTQNTSSSLSSLCWSQCSSSSITVGRYFSLRALVQVRNGLNKKSEEIQISRHFWSYPYNRLWRPIGLGDVETPTFSRQSARRWRWGFHSLTYQPPFTPQEDSWYSFLLEAESTPRP
jgi:hypothetical protein